MTNPSEIYMHTASCRRFCPFAPTQESIDAFTIARHLSTQARWSGATSHPSDPTRIFYSVAEHSVYCADYVANELKRPDLAFEALMHDASEAYISDMIRPLKYSPAFYEIFKSVEEPIEQVIAAKYGLKWPMSPEVKMADEAVCEAEYRQIVTTGKKRQGEKVMHDQSICADIEIQMLYPHEAFRLFRNKVVELAPYFHAVAA